MVYSFFHNSSIFCIWLSSVAAFIAPFLIQKKGINRLLSITFVCITLLVVILLGGRAGLLGLGVALIFIYWKADLVAYLIKIPVFFASFAVAFLLLLYVSKPGSTSGRLHIYSVSLQIIKDNWLTGTSIGKFKAVFNEYQATYFMQQDIDSKRALLADNTFYAFNDYLQWLAETGILGLVLLCLFIYSLVWRINGLIQVYSSRPALMGAIASLISLSVAALFSYPFQVLPIQFTALILLGIIIFFPDKKVFRNKGERIFTNVTRLIFVPLSAFFIYHSTLHIRSKNWENKAFQLSLAGRKTDALDFYRKLATHYPAYGHHKYLYAEQCYYMNQLQKADSTLAEAQKKYIDNRVYSLKAKINFEKGNLKEAEQNYLMAIYTVPNRMMSRYDLVIFYANNKDTLKALQWAYSIRKMPVKVRSEKTYILLNQVNQLVNELEQKPNVLKPGL